MAREIKILDKKTRRMHPFGEYVSAVKALVTDGDFKTVITTSIDKPSVDNYKARFLHISEVTNDVLVEWIAPKIDKILAN